MVQYPKGHLWANIDGFFSSFNSKYQYPTTFMLPTSPHKIWYHIRFSGPNICKTKDEIVKSLSVNWLLFAEKNIYLIWLNHYKHCKFKPSRDENISSLPANLFLTNRNLLERLCPVIETWMPLFQPEKCLSNVRYYSLTWARGGNFRGL